MENVEKNIYATQFHSELGGCGEEVFDNFLFDICKFSKEKENER